MGRVRYIGQIVCYLDQVNLKPPENNLAWAQLNFVRDLPDKQVLQIVSMNKTQRNPITE